MLGRKHKKEKQIICSMFCGSTKPCSNLNWDEESIIQTVAVSTCDVIYKGRARKLPDRLNLSVSVILSWVPAQPYIKRVTRNELEFLSIFV